MLQIDGISIAVPKDFNVSINDIDGQSERNAKGELIRDRIAVKRKLECAWPLLKQSEISTLLNAVSSVFFTVTYPDPKDGVVTKTFYVGDRNTPMYRNVNGNVRWEGLKMNFIEK